MGKKRATKATTNIQPYVGPESLDTPEQREVDQDQATGSPAQQAVASPSETAAENAKAQKRLRMQFAFGNPMAAMALVMRAVQDNLISNAFQTIENANQPCLELPSPPEQREVDHHPPTDSPAQEAVASPSEPATNQAARKKRNVKPKNDAMASWCIDRRNDGWPWKKIVKRWNKDNPPEHPVDALTERKGSQAAYNYRERLKKSQDNKQ